MFEFWKTLVLSPWLESKIIFISCSAHFRCDAHGFIGVSHIVSQGNIPGSIALSREQILSFHTLEHPYPSLGLQMEIFGFLTYYPLPGLNCFVQFGIIFVWNIMCKVRHPASLFSFFPKALCL